MESVQRYELPNYSQLLWWGRKSLAARQHPTHPQGTVIWHLSCSKASVDPAGEHHNLYLRFSAPPGPAGRVSIHYGSALLVINSCCAAKMQGEPAEVLGRMVDDPLCYNWLSRNEHHPMGYKFCTGNLGDMGFPKWLGSKGIQGADRSDWGLWSSLLKGHDCSALFHLELAKLLFITGQT